MRFGVQLRCYGLVFAECITTLLPDCEVDRSEIIFTRLTDCIQYVGFACTRWFRLIFQEERPRRLGGGRCL